MTADDRQLLLLTHRGNDAAARALWAAHAPRLLVYARAVLSDHQLAEDVVQSVFCKILTLDRRTLEDVNDVATWLAAVVRRQALNHLRGNRRELARRRRAAADEEIHPSLQMSDSLERALGSLHRRLREVVVLKHVAGLTFEQIALALAMNRNTAAARYRTAIAALREALNEPTEVSHG